MALLSFINLPGAAVVAGGPEVQLLQSAEQVHSQLFLKLLHHFEDCTSEHVPLLVVVALPLRPSPSREISVTSSDLSNSEK